MRDGLTRSVPWFTNKRFTKLKPYSIEIFLKSLKSLSIFPVPSTTLASGSSAMETGNPVSSRILVTRFFSNAPPPVRTMPWSPPGNCRAMRSRFMVASVAAPNAADARVPSRPSLTRRSAPAPRPAAPAVRTAMRTTSPPATSRSPPAENLLNPSGFCGSHRFLPGSVALARELI